MSKAALYAEAQKLAPSALVELFTLDTSMLTNIYGQAGTGSVYHWCPGTLNGAAVVFDGVTYAPLPIAASGFEWNGQGRLPTPKLQISNISGLATGLVVQFGDMLGATVTRQRTMAKFLDGQSTSDPTCVFEPDIFRIDRKSAQNKQYVEFELAADLDQMGVRLPKQQVLADACNQTYRVFRNGGYIYGTCPYAGSASFDISDQSTTQDKDVCSHRLTGCLARYGTATPLPFGAFPGVSETVT